MYLPLLDVGQPFSSLAWLRDAIHAVVLYLAAFFVTAGGSGAPSSATTANVDVSVNNGQYLIGVGIGDVTGPVVETNMMGYASLSQTDTGLHMRQRSRAFIIADPSNPTSPTSRILLISSDICMGDTGVRRSILSALSSDPVFGGLYTASNTALVGTHSHSGVGGYLEDLLPQVSSLGYVNQTAQAIVDGTLEAIRKAHISLAPGSVRAGNTTLSGANRNRSPSAYVANPEDERARYQYDQDKELSVLRLDDTNGNPRGLISFFAVHGTSLYNNNTLVSGDNKGMAAYLYESYIEPNSMPGNTTFVAAFVQSNVGDTSPNTLGAYCESPGKPYNGEPCEYEHSTCGGRTEDCRGRGPAFRVSDYASNFLIGTAQFEAAREVMESSPPKVIFTSPDTTIETANATTLTDVRGAVKSVHVYMDMMNHTFTLPNGTIARTCPAALGYSFAGGTSDGPGAFDFIQGVNSSAPRNPFWEIVKGAVSPYPSQEQIACHYPKPILLNTGYANTPYQWSPHTVDVQMLRVGNFIVLVIPGELTTMAGRRMREALRAQLISSGILDDSAYVVIAGPANTYGHYVTTREEYSVQRYEGASTIFGPATLEAYINMYNALVPYVADNATGTPPSDDAPPEQTSKAISLQTPPIVDRPPLFKAFGDVLVDVNSTPYSAGDTVAVRFIGANPRNNLRLEGTFFTVNQLIDGAWTTVRTDSHPSTIYQWDRTNTLLGTSTIDIRWTIEDATPAGTYQITYYGDAKQLIGGIKSFTGASSPFTVA
ncbi:Neutral/alkaline nonlysosomal ceramidase [Paxillus ammoniavirescens]|nr:Neutral/alkaline nonlysosomal ceramidase [Paxillus ammoniavirescens]